MSARLEPAELQGDFLRLDGKSMVLTGASAGLGVQFARALSAAGARLTLGARRLEPMQRLAEGLGDCELVRSDVADADDRERLISTAKNAYGTIDGLVNNAGIANMTPAFKETSEDFRRVIEVDLIAPFPLARRAAEEMRSAGKGGSIVNITSVAALRSFHWNAYASYVAAKSGLGGLTRELASQWGRYGIRVNSIAPGPFTTEITGDQYERGPIADLVRERLPLRRAGAPGEMNGALLLLLHPAGQYITGQTLAVDGGMTISS